MAFFYFRPSKSNKKVLGQTGQFHKRFCLADLKIFVKNTSPNPPNEFERERRLIPNCTFLHKLERCVLVWMFFWIPSKILKIFRKKRDFRIFPKIPKKFKIFREIQKTIQAKKQRMFFCIYLLLYFRPSKGQKEFLMAVFKVSVFWVQVFCHRSAY